MEKAKELTEKGNLTELDKCKHELKYANFLKRSGYYTKATDLILKLENKVYLVGDDFGREFKFRVTRDKARALAISNKIDESMEAFDMAEKMLDHNKKNVKFGKCVYLRGLASKRISSEVAIEKFEQCMSIFYNIFGTDQTFFICQSMYEMGQIKKRMEAYEEVQDLYKECGKFTAKYFDDKELYGESSGENHPVMQQYFLLMHEWAASIRDINIEKVMLEKYVKLSELNSKPTTSGKKSIFMLECKFQEL